MQPAFNNNDLVLVNKLSYLFKNPELNDVVAIKNPALDKEKRYIIKRVVKIKKNKYFVEGDNKKESTDSRSFGWIGRENIIGKIII